MTITVADLTKVGYYDSVAGKVHTGERMIMGENLGAPKYFNGSHAYCNVMKGSTNLNFSDYLRLGNNEYIDDGAAWNMLSTGTDKWIKQGTWVLKWTGAADMRFTPADSTTRSVTVTPATNIINLPSSVYFNNVVVRFTTTDTLPAGLSLLADYYIVNADDGGSNDFQVSLTEGGAPVNITDTGSGTHYLNWVELTSSSANRKEYLIYGSRSAGNGSIKVEIGTCTEIAFIQPGEEARHDAGNIFTSTFLADMAGIGVLRTMGMQNTNDSYMHDFDELPLYDNLNWFHGLSPRALAKLSEETGSDIWVCIPHQFTDAAVTSFAIEMNTYLPGGRKVYIEYSNETWNSASGFGDQASWIERGDIDAVDAVMTPATGSVLSTTHGLTTGDVLKFFNTKDPIRTMNGNDIWPYYGGGQSYIIADDVNNFRVCNVHAVDLGRRRDITGATQANPCVITSVGHAFSNGETIHPYEIVGMTELNGNDYTTANVTTDTFELSGINSTGYTAYASGGYALRLHVDLDPLLTKVRYKTSGSVLTGHENHANRSVEVFALCKAQLGSKMYSVTCGQRTNPDVLTQRFAVQALRDTTDFASIASYYRFNNWQEPTIDDVRDLLTGDTHTGSTSSITLTDSTKTAGYAWTTDEWVGELLVNNTDRSWGTITGNTSNALTVASLTGGTNNEFQNGDTYRISLYANATPAEITTYLKTINGPAVLQQQADNIAVSGRYNLVNYEGADHSTGPSFLGDSKVQPEINAMIAWGRDAAAEDFTNWWPKALATAGVKVYCHHVSHGEYIDAIWGRMEHPGDTDAPKHVGHIEFYNNGGAPKL